MSLPPARTESALVFAVVTGSSAAKPHLATLCRELSQTLDREVTPKILPSYTALPKWLESGGAHIVWAPPLVAVEIARSGAATLVLSCSRGGDTGYHAALFTQHSSSIATLTDLKGVHVAWVDSQSAAGYVVPRMHLAREGLDPTKLFGRESFLGTHERVAIAVLDGDADVGATYVSLDPVTKRPMSAGWLEAGAGVNGAFVLATAGPIPSDAIALSNRLTPETRAKITKALTRLPVSAPESVGALFRADGFVPAQIAAFDELAKLAASLHEREGDGPKRAD